MWLAILTRANTKVPPIVRKCQGAERLLISVWMGQPGRPPHGRRGDRAHDGSVRPRRGAAAGTGGQMQRQAHRAVAGIVVLAAVALTLIACSAAARAGPTRPSPTRASAAP